MRQTCAVGTDTETLTEAEPLTPAERRELLDTVRRVDALLTEFEPTIRAMANMPMVRMAVSRHGRKG